jgi:hypothetical protein
MSGGAKSSVDDHLHELSGDDWDALTRSVGGFVSKLRPGERPDMSATSEERTRAAAGGPG